MRYGFVYVLFNPARPGVAKIGATSRSPMNRVAELNAQHRLPESFELMILAEFDGYYAAERELHAMFANLRVDGTEFFRLGLDEIQQIQRYASEHALLQYSCEMVNEYLDLIGQYKRPDEVALQ